MQAYQAVLVMSESSEPLRILVAGDVNGQVGQLFKRVSALLQKPPKFNFLFCTGNFFGPDGFADDEWANYKSGELVAPIATYILGPSTPQQAQHYEGLARGGDLCENIAYLGPCGTINLAGNLRVAFVSGPFNPAPRADVGAVGHTRADIEPLINQFSKSYTAVDVLLSSVLPAGVFTNSASQPGDSAATATASPLVAAAARVLCPRYHFSGASEYFERVPFRNFSGAEPPRAPTRFLCIAPVGNAAKHKWLYAFTIVPSARLDPVAVVRELPDSTACPYGQKAVVTKQDGSFFHGNGGEDTRAAKRRREDGGRQPPAGYVCRKCHNAGHYIQDCPAGGRDREREERPAAAQGPCWFCLSNPQVEKHLVASVGQHTYVALPKGELTFGHVLLLPIAHVGTLGDLAPEAREEIDKYKDSLRRLFASRGEACVFFERNFRSQHLQIQVVPVPQACEDKIGPEFSSQFQRLQAEVSQLPAGASLTEATSGAPYFAAELPSGEVLLHLISGRFPLQFGREVLAAPTLLNVPERVDWKACVSSTADEKEHTAQFRKMFRPFDFNFA
eukprot:m.23755 g.23755  ORF g.23755 m.23755 type:complete len:561 (+) comp3935_c0_seq1:20-1702(+)